MQGSATAARIRILSLTGGQDLGLKKDAATGFKVEHRTMLDFLRLFDRLYQQASQYSTLGGAFAMLLLIAARE